MKRENPTKRLLELLANIATGRVETNILELFELFSAQKTSPILEKITLVKARLADLALCLIPGFEAGDLETVRCIDFIQRSAKSREFVMAEIVQRESGQLEFKSSLLYDYDKAKYKPESTTSELRSEAVLHSALKSIAAFLTSNGGVLYIGLGPQGGIIGLEKDFRCANENVPNSDGWELSFRDFVKTRFKDGGIVNPYIAVEFPTIDGKTIARLQISPRTKLSFLLAKEGKGWAMYRRDGNRTVEVTIDQVEEYISVRSGLKLSRL